MGIDIESEGIDRAIATACMKMESLLQQVRERSGNIPPAAQTLDELASVLNEMRIAINEANGQNGHLPDPGLALEASHDWALTFDAVPDMIAILDNQHRIVRMNASMARRLGDSPDHLVGLNCFACMHGTDGPIAGCPHALTLRDGREHFAEMREEHIGADLLISTTPLYNEQGKVIGSVHVARDITERKRSERALKAANEELSRFNAAMVGRELRMIELKKEVNELCQCSGQAERYPLDFEEEMR